MHYDAPVKLIPKAMQWRKEREERFWNWLDSQVQPMTEEMIIDVSKAPKHVVSSLVKSLEENDRIISNIAYGQTWYYTKR